MKSNMEGGGLRGDYDPKMFDNILKSYPSLHKKAWASLNFP